MNINTHSPLAPIVSREPVRTQVSADSSPESTVVQSRNAAPVPDVRVVQQANESSSSNGFQDPKFDVKQDGTAKDLNGGDKPEASTQVKESPAEPLSDNELRQIEQLASRDREVRAHEQAHLSAAGSRATSGASFTYTDGPDGKRYATGGEVSIDTSPVRGDPEATLRAAELIQRAALAPASPSAQDRQVAAAANAMAQVATVELSQLQAEEARAVSSSESSTLSSGEVVESEGVVVGSAIFDTAIESVEEEGDGRNALAQSRQQQLEDAYGVVQQRRADNEHSEELGNVISSSETDSGVQQTVAQAPGVDISVQFRQGGAEVSAVAQEARVAVAPVSADNQAAAAKESQVPSVEVVRAAAPATTEAAVVNGSASQESTIDMRDEQVKNRQLQLEGAFNTAAQGLGGEPRGANLDYFL